MDPFSSINIVLFMISQDEKQQKVISSSAIIESIVAFAVQGNSKNFKKKRPICSYCGVVGHTT